MRIIKELLNKQNEIRKKLNVFIEKNTVSEDEDKDVSSSLSDLMGQNGGSMKTFKLETIEDVQYYQSLIEEEKQLVVQVRVEYENYKLMKERINKINIIRNNENS